jgi:hypothetical protein
MTRARPPGRTIVRSTGFRRPLRALDAAREALYQRTRITVSDAVDVSAETSGVDEPTDVPTFAQQQADALKGRRVERRAQGSIV